MEDFLFLYLVYVGITVNAFSYMVKWWWEDLKSLEARAWSLLIEFYFMGFHYLVYLLFYLRRYDNLVAAYIINTVGLFIIASAAFYQVAFKTIFRT